MPEVAKTIGHLEQSAFIGIILHIKFDLEILRIHSTTACVFGIHFINGHLWRLLDLLIGLA